MSNWALSAFIFKLEGEQIPNPEKWEQAFHSRGHSLGHLPEVRKLVEAFFIDVKWEVNELTTTAQVGGEGSLSIYLGNLRDEPNGVKGDESVDFLFVIADEMTDYWACGQFCQVNGLSLYNIDLDVFLIPKKLLKVLAVLNQSTTIFVRLATSA